MQAKTALIGTDGAVELDAEAVVDLHLPLVVHPRNAEQNLPFRRGQTLQQCLAAELLLVCLHNGAQGFQNLPDSLMKFGLSRILRDYALNDLIYIRHRGTLLCFFVIGSYYTPNPPGMQEGFRNFCKKNEKYFISLPFAG